MQVETTFFLIRFYLFVSRYLFWAGGEGVSESPSTAGALAGPHRRMSSAKSINVTLMPSRQFF